MKPFYQDDWLTIHQGDCRAVLATLEAGSVHTVVTSPPYWGLRDYGTASWEGGDADCDHSFRADAGATTQRAGRSYQQGHPHRECRCGATRQDAQLGLEPTPEEYVANMVAVFREVRRVLRDDGTLWLNLGDCYGSGPGAPSDKSTLRGNGHVGGGPKVHAVSAVGNRAARVISGNAMFDFKPKDLVGIPWLVALALRADGWYLRSDIIWAKPNPMPESVTDRPTKSHEYLFLLSKSERYWWDADAVREEASQPAGVARLTGQHKADAGGFTTNGHGPSTLGTNQGPSARNIRSVWTIATQPYPGAHFATFPPKLVEPCILAGAPDKACATCGAPWERVLGDKVPVAGRGSGNVERKIATNGERSRLDTHMGSSVPWNPSITPTTGWRPTCAHADAPTVPGVVLDPFGGSGTTAMVAQHLGRRAVLIELNPDYITQQLRRNQDVPLGLSA